MSSGSSIAILVLIADYSKNSPVLYARARVRFIANWPRQLSWSCLQHPLMLAALLQPFARQPLLKLVNLRGNLFYRFIYRQFSCRERNCSGFSLNQTSCIGTNVISYFQHPRWPGQNRPCVATSKPATGQTYGTGISTPSFVPKSTNVLNHC